MSKTLGHLIDDYNKFGLELVGTSGIVNVHITVSVPKESLITDKDGTPMCGNYLAKKFKRDISKYEILEKGSFWFKYIERDEIWNGNIQSKVS